jgi:cytochrome b561
MLCRVAERGARIIERMPLASRYTRFAVFMHWLVAAVVLLQYPLGWWMQTIAKQPPGPRVEMFNLHKSIGMAVCALMIARLAWRLGHPPPALPPMPRWQATAARATHWLFYLLLIAMPLSGYLGSVFSGFPVKFFGVTLPSWAAKNPALKDAMSTAHLVLAWLLLAVFALHVLAVAKHVWISRDGLMQRMRWGRGSPGGADHLRDA